MRRPFRLAAPASACILFCVLAVGSAFTTNPFPNEAWFASPANNLLLHGHMGTTVLESSGTWIDGIDRRTYWIPPGYILAQTAWFDLAGFSLTNQRLLSVIWGVVALLSIYLLILKLAGIHAAIMATLLTATDYRFVHLGTTGRMDMMCAALGFAGLAAYAGLRKKSFFAGIVISHALAAASCLTHPCGVLYAAGLVLLIFLLDKRNFGKRCVILAALPYLLGLAAWGWYILPEPDTFLRQFLGNISGMQAEAGGGERFSGLSQPLTALKHEMGGRYLASFGRYAPWLSPKSVQLAVFAFFAIGIIGALLSTRARRRAGPRALLGLGALWFCMLWLLDGTKASPYLVHSMPLALAAVAIWIRNWRIGRRRQFAAPAVLAILWVNSITIASEIWRNPRKNDYDQAAGFVLRYVNPDQLVMGSAEMAYRLGFSGSLVDDVRLGAKSGKRPDCIIVGPWYKDWQKSSQQREPEVYRHIRRLLDEEFQEVARTESYVIYRRKGRA